MADGAADPAPGDRGIFGSIGHFFSDGWNKLKEGNFKEMSWGQIGTAALVGGIALYAAFTTLQILWETVEKFLPYIIMAAVAVVGIFLLMGSLGRKSDTTPEKAPVDTSALQERRDAETQALALKGLGKDKMDKVFSTQLDVADVDRVDLPTPVLPVLVADETRDRNTAIMTI